MIEYGDLFLKHGVIVIPFNHFFDTEVNCENIDKNNLTFDERN